MLVGRHLLLSVAYGAMLLLLIQFRAVSSAQESAETRTAKYRATSAVGQTIIEVVSTETGKFDSVEIDESSGVVASRNHPGKFWTHNDNADDLRLFLVDESGRLHAIVQLTGIKASDVEDIAAFHCNDESKIVLGDVGDNAAVRKTCNLFLLDEPKLALKPDTVVQAKCKDIYTIEFAYDDGSRNCEALAVDPEREDVWLVTKESFAGPVALKKRRPHLYRLSIKDHEPGKVLTARKVMLISDPLTTGMDISFDNKTAVIRTYTYARIFHRPNDRTWEETFKSDESKMFGLPTQIQGEAICFLPDNVSLLITSEQPGQPLWKISLNSTKE